MSGPLIFSICCGLFVAVSVSYVILGAAADARMADSRERRQRAVDAFATILFADDAAAVEGLSVSRGIERDTLVEVVATLPAELGADGRDRLRAILETPRSCRTFARLVSSRRWRQRADAARMCGLMGSESQRERLLNDSHWAVRMVALGALSPEQVANQADQVVDRLLDADPAVRRAASDVLPSGGVDVVLPLNTVLQESGPDRTAALLAAGRISDRMLIGALVRCSRSDHGEVRALSATALSRQSPVEVEAILCDLLTDSEADVRAAAALGLSTASSPCSLVALRRVLSDDSWRVRRAAEQSLRLRGPAGGMLVRQNEARRGELAQANPIPPAVPLPVGVKQRTRP